MLVSVINGGSVIQVSIRFEFILKAVRVIRGIVRKSLAQEVKRCFQDLSPFCLYRMRMPKSRVRKRMETNANSAITLRSIVEEKATEKCEAAILEDYKAIYLRAEPRGPHTSGLTIAHLLNQPDIQGVDSIM